MYFIFPSGAYHLLPVRSSVLLSFSSTQSLLARTATATGASSLAAHACSNQRRPTERSSMYAIGGRPTDETRTSALAAAAALAAAVDAKEGLTQIKQTEKQKHACLTERSARGQESALCIDIHIALPLSCLNYPANHNVPVA